MIVSSSLTHELDHTGWMFDKHRGFMLKKVDSWLLSGSYMCLAKRTKKAKTDKSAIQYARFEVVVGGKSPQHNLWYGKTFKSDSA